MKTLLISAAFVLWFGLISHGQTNSFRYQGSLTDAGNPATGDFQMQFKLFDAASGGTQQGTTLADLPVTVTNGVFSVELNFGSGVFTGANRWLEIAVRRDSGDSYNTLNPRQQVASSPYAIRTLSAAMADDSQKLGGIAANQYVTTTTAGSAFVRNDTSLQTANFNITGNGRVGGNFGIGTATPNAGLELRGVGAATQQRITDAVSGNSLVLQGGPGENMKVTGYNYGTGTAQPLYLSTDGANTLINSNGGVLGVGTNNPHPGYRADFFGGVRSISNGASHFVAETMGGTNSWARFYMRSSNLDGSLNRSWFIGTSRNFNGDQLYIGDETANQTRMVIATNGNVGIGHTNPPARLWVDGHVAQRDSSYGLPKAMLLVRENGFGAPFIEKCYNAVTQNLTPPCNISLVQPGGAGLITVSFSFRVTDRFISLTPIYATTLPSYAHVAGFDSGDISGGSIYVYAHGYESNPADFYMIVF